MTTLQASFESENIANCQLPIGNGQSTPNPRSASDAGTNPHGGSAGHSATHSAAPHGSAGGHAENRTPAHRPASRGSGLIPAPTPPATFFIYACSALILTTAIILFVIFFPVTSCAIFLISLLWFLLMM